MAGADCQSRRNLVYERRMLAVRLWNDLFSFALIFSSLRNGEVARCLRAPVTFLLRGRCAITVGLRLGRRRSYLFLLSQFVHAFAQTARQLAG